MANVLGREIKQGERVVVRDDIYDDATHVFICEHGFGLHMFTGSTAIVGRWESNGAHGRISGTFIDVEKTNAIPDAERMSS